jgi:hypothetical protein
MFIATFQRRLRTPLGVQCELLVEPEHIASIVKLKHSFLLEYERWAKHGTPKGVRDSFDDLRL